MSISKTRQKLIDIARQLFAKNGVANTTMNDIAVASGKGRRTLYTYFNSKEEVYSAVIESELERLSDKLDEVAAMKMRPLDKVIELIYTHLIMIRETVVRNGNLRAEFFRNIWMVEKVRKKFDDYEIDLFRKVYQEGKADGEFDIDDVNLVADITHYCIKGLEVPFIYGRIGHGLTDMEAKVNDLLAKRFISVFYPDCKFSTTTVLGEVINEDGPKPEKMEFKVSGKEILEPGWRVVYAKDAKNADDDDADNANGNDGGNAGDGNGNGAKKEVVEERTLPSFVKGESGDHQPTLTEKWTTPPKYYTEATLLRAMETAGKFVEDEELRAALKENGIGRPSSRAGIIETLFKRHYIRRQRKNLMATPTGIELIDTIHEELLKSCELTGIWEKKLRDIEHKTYDPAEFINGLKEQINQIVIDVLSDNSSRRVTIMTEEDLKKKPEKKKTAAKKPEAKKAPAKKKDEATAQNASAAQAPADPMVGKPCPLCGKGVIIKGKTAYGCSNWKSGCQYRQPFSQM